MKKPQGYVEARAFGEFETLPAGGYKCIIKKVVCETAANGQEYLKMAIDIDEGQFKGFFQKKFDSDTREDKKWSGIWGVFINGYEPGTTNPKYKGLITSIEVSNPGFQFDHINEKELENKKVGIVFREEDFEGSDLNIYTIAKPLYAVSYDEIEHVKIPNPKRLTTVTESDIKSSADMPF